MNKKFAISILLTFIFTTSFVFSQSTRNKGTTAPKPAPAKAATKPKSDSTATAPLAAEPAAPIDDKPLRVEKEAKNIGDGYSLLTPAGKEGVVLTYMSDQKSAKGRKFKDWVITKYDNQFNEQFNKTFTFDEEITLVQTYVDEDTKHMYALFAKNEDIPQLPKANGITGKFEIYDLDLTSNTINVIAGELKQKMHINVFKSIGDDIYLGGSTMATMKMIRKAQCTALMTCFIGGAKRFDMNPYLIRISASKHKVEDVNVSLQKQGEILSVDADSISKKIFAAVIDAPMPFDRNIAILEINGNKATRLVKIAPQKEYVLLDGKLVSISEQERVVLGSYIKVDAKQKSKMSYGLEGKRSKNMPAATGFYISKFTGTKQDYVKYYPFTKFKDLQDMIKKEGKGKAKKEKRIEAQINSYNILVHEIIQRGDELVIIGDAYYAHYHTEYYTTTSTNANGGTTTTTHSRQVFDGWMFTHSLLAGFDKTGEMKWNAAFKLPEVLTWRLRPQVKILPNSNTQNVVMLYNYNGSIKSKILNGETLESGVDYAKIDTGSDKDKIKSSSYSNIEYWYGNFFIAYGFEKIKNTEKNSDKKKKRNVFYLNKIAYR